MNLFKHTFFIICSSLVLFGLLPIYTYAQARSGEMVVDTSGISILIGESTQGLESDKNKKVEGASKLKANNHEVEGDLGEFIERMPVKIAPSVIKNSQPE